MNTPKTNRDQLPQARELKNLSAEIEDKLRREGLIRDRPLRQRCQWCAQETEDWDHYEGNYLNAVLCFDCWLEADWVEALLSDRGMPVHRHVRLDRVRHAVFLRDEESRELWLLTPGSMDALPYFDPGERTDETVVNKIKTYLPFA